MAEGVWDTGEAVNGGIGGATAGAAAGGPWGALIGGLAGFGLGGAMGNPADEWNKKLQQLSDFYGQRQALQMGPAHLAGDSGLLSNRAQLIAQLEAQARGDGPSAARLQMQQAADRTAQMLASNAAGAGGRGVNAGAAMRNAGNQAANVMQTNNQNMGILRAQEMLNASGQLGGVLGQGIGQDNQMNQFNAQAMNNRDAFNIQTAMQQMQANDAMQRQMYGFKYGGGAPQGVGSQLMGGGAMAAPSLASMFGGGDSNKKPANSTTWYSDSEGAPAGSNNISHNVPFGTPYNTGS